MPTHLIRHACGRSRWKADSRIGNTNSADDHCHANQTKENGEPAAANARCENPPEANCERNEQRSGDYKVGNLNPPKLAERKETRRVSDQIKALARKSENERNDDEQRSRYHSRCKER